MGKKLLDTKNDAWKELTRIRGLIVSTWENETLPYPEPGIRLIKRSEINPFSARMDRIRADLKEAERDFDRRYPALCRDACTRLGELYNPKDYPESVIGYFDACWEFPNLEPPEHLRMLSPTLYRQETERVRNRFNEAVVLAEQAFFTELQDLVEHLLRRLSGSDDGKPKIFRDSVIDNFHEFFERFQRLNIGSSVELNNLVASARRIVGNVTAQDLRTNASVKAHVTNNFAEVRTAIDELLVERPRRNLRRPGATANQTNPV
jgi:hypothetical protein